MMNIFIKSFSNSPEDIQNDEFDFIKGIDISYN